MQNKLSLKQNVPLFNMQVKHCFQFKIILVFSTHVSNYSLWNSHLVAFMSSIFKEIQWLNHLDRKARTFMNDKEKGIKFSIVCSKNIWHFFFCTNQHQMLDLSVINSISDLKTLGSIFIFTYNVPKVPRPIGYWVVLWAVSNYWFASESLCLYQM